MSLSSYADIAGVDLDIHDEPIAAGDRVTVGISRTPVYAVIAVHAGRAWVVREDCPDNPVFEGITSAARLKRAPAQVIQLDAAA